MGRLGGMYRLAGVVILTICVACDAAPSPPASENAASTAPSSNETVDASEQLAGIAWWRTELMGFGVIPEAPIDPNPPLNPGGYRELVVGTLDGRVTAVMALHDAWSRSSVSGPYGTDVLVANDVGTQSEVFMISARDGTRRDLFASDAIVAAAAVGDGGRSVYYLELDRGSLISTGLFRRPIEGGPPELVLEGSITEDSPEPVVYWVTADPIVDRVVVQWCFGQVQCTSYLLDPRDGSFVTQDTLGWPLGAGPTTFFGNGLASSPNALAWRTGSGEVDTVAGARHSVPVATGGGWRFVRDEEGDLEQHTVLVGPAGREERIPGADPALSTIGTLGENRGVALPPGWVLRWPGARFFSVEEGPPGGDGQLIAVGTGQRVTLPRPELVVTVAPTCEPPIPSEMPGGQRAGPGVRELLAGRRTIRWGTGEDRVILAPGHDALAGASDGEPVVVRGHEGRLTAVGDEGVGEVLFTWSDGTCANTVWLAPGTTLDEARDYAERY